jgi:hypothetical protein
MIGLLGFLFLTGNQGDMVSLQSLKDHTLVIPVKTEADLTGNVEAANDDQYRFVLAGSFTVESDCFLPKRGLVSSTGGHDSTLKITLDDASLRTGYDDARVTKSGDYSHLRGVSLFGDTPDKPLMICNECHWQILDTVSFRGTKEAGTPLLKLGATLYNRIRDCDFGGTGEGDGINAQITGWDVTYYGWNASWVETTNFNVRGAAITAVGNFSLRNSTIENTTSVNHKIILGDEGEVFQTTRALIDNVYFEIQTDSSSASVINPIRVIYPSRVIVQNCEHHQSDGGHADAANSTFIKAYSGAHA